MGRGCWPRIATLGRGPRQAREREDGIVAAFVDLADGLVGDLDVQDLLHRLAEHCVDPGRRVGLRDPAGRRPGFPVGVGGLPGSCQRPGGTADPGGGRTMRGLCPRRCAGPQRRPPRRRSARWPSWAPVAMRERRPQRLRHPAADREHRDRHPEPFRIGPQRPRRTRSARRSGTRRCRDPHDPAATACGCGRSAERSAPDRVELPYPDRAGQRTDRPFPHCEHGPGVC